MSENMKIWVETHSLLNIWSWIEKVCLNDKNSESATRADNNWSHRLSLSLDSESAWMTWTKQVLSNAIDSNQKWVCFKDTWQEEINLKRLNRMSLNTQWNELETLNEMSLKHLNRTVMNRTRRSWLKQWDHCLTEKEK